MFEVSAAVQSDRPLGAMLGAARAAQSIPLEKAARDTRIRVQRLKEIESDDFSRFTHPSYARLYLADYAKYLGVPFSEIRSQLPEAGQCGTEGYQYLQDIPEGVAAQVARRLRPRRRLMPVFAAAALLAVLALGAIQLWVTLRNINRLGNAQVARTEKVEPVKTGLDPAEAAADKEALETLPPQASSNQNSNEAVLFVGGAVDQRTDRVQ
ncbi:MAG: helix-turn-helix domain-containing protein [Terrimicrobiaceae bacterium]